MFFRFIFVLIALALNAPAARAALSRAPAAADSWQACRQAVLAAERQAGIPADLLWSIALVESGRWDRGAQARVAWPWTINAEGRGSFHATKEAAIAEVAALQAQGVRSIDVGCMQVNLRHHPDAFASLEDAFDPVINAAYAARFLSALSAETGSWEAAAGRYHSATPALGEAYRERVLAQWTGTGADARQPRERPQPATATAPPREPPLPNVFAIAPIDTERMARI
ncbi:MAG: lytic transglycosylase domain-containing protein, partial [Defluviicoccus sp.]